MENISMILIVFNLLILLGIWGYSIINYSKLPQKIPIHFNIEGEADRFAGKKMFFFLPIVALAIFILFVFMLNDVEQNKYPVETTNENSQIQYFLGETFSQVILGICLNLFLVIQVYTVKYINQKKTSLVGVAVCIISLFLVIMTYSIISNNYK